MLNSIAYNTVHGTAPLLEYIQKVLHDWWTNAAAWLMQRSLDHKYREVEHRLGSPSAERPAHHVSVNAAHGKL